MGLYSLSYRNALTVVHFIKMAWDWNSLGFVELTPAHTNWTHLSFPVKAPGDKVHHLTLKLGENNLTNTVIYNIDNLRWTELAAVLPPPTMAIEETKAGLNLLAASGGQYDRQNIATVASDTFGWIGSSVPKTSLTSCPGPLRPPVSCFKQTRT